MKRMEYQTIINIYAVIAISGMITAIIAIGCYGITVHKHDKAFEKTQIEYKEKVRQRN